MTFPTLLLSFLAQLYSLKIKIPFLLFKCLAVLPRSSWHQSQQRASLVKGNIGCTTLWKRNAWTGKKRKKEKKGEEIPFHSVCFPKCKWYLVQELLLSFPLITTMLMFFCAFTWAYIILIILLANNNLVFMHTRAEDPNQVYPALPQISHTILGNTGCSSTLSSRERDKIRDDPTTIS